MILNYRAKNYTSERTIVPWTVIFSWMMLLNSPFCAFLFEEIRRVYSESVYPILNQWMNQQFFYDNFASCKYHPIIPIYELGVSKPDKWHLCFCSNFMPFLFSWRLVILKFHFVILNIPFSSSIHID